MGQRGNVRGGIIVDLSLDVDPSEIGDVLSIYVAQSADSVASWKLQVAAGSDAGLEIVGSGVTTPPGTAGEPPSRLVGVAHAPGTKRWRVSCSHPNPNEEAWITLVSSKSAGGIPIGLTMAKNGTQNATGNLTRFDANNVLSAPITGDVLGATLWQLEGQLVEAAIPGASTFVMLFDQVLAPAAGDVPIWVRHLGQVAGAPSDPTYYQYQPQNGYLVQHQLWVATSTNGATFAADAAHHVTVHAISGTRG